MRKATFALIIALFLIVVIVLALAMTPSDIVVKRSDVAVMQMARLNGTSPGYFGDSNFEVADFNRDGFMDLVISVCGKNLSYGPRDFTGQVHIYYGGVEGIHSYTAAQANVTFNGTSPSEFGAPVLASDFNRDNYTDLAIGAYIKNLSNGEADNTGQVYIFYGSADGMHSYSSPQANVTLNGTSPGAFGYPLATSDFNRDNYTDLAIGAYIKNLSNGEADNTGQVYIFYGSADGLHSYTSNQANVTFNGTSPSYFGLQLLANDFNRDNYTDLVVSAINKNLSNGEADDTGQAYIFYGSADGMHPYTSDQANVTFNGTSPSYFGYGLAANDFNKDNFRDLVIAAPDKNLSYGARGSCSSSTGIPACEGQVHIFYGSADGLHSYTSDQANVTFNGTSAGRLGRNTISTEDFNNDGYLDLTFGAYTKNLSHGRSDSTGQVYIFYGDANGFRNTDITQANVTLNGTVTGGGFGFSIYGHDLNNDTLPELIISATYTNLSGGAPDLMGSVYIYTFNLRPSAFTIPNQSWNEDTAIIINLSMYFNDTNNDELNYSWSVGPNIGASINETTNIVTLTPNANWYGIEYITFYANDSYNDLVASNNITLTVSNTVDCGDNTCDSSESCTSCASDCGACPAVSGSSTAAAEQKAAHTFTTITPESPATADFKNIAVSSITLTTDETANNVRLEVKEVSKTDAPMPETGVYKLIEIKASNIELKEAKIKFKVKLAWLEENDVEQGEVVLMHHKTGWEPLKTAYTGKDDENAYYEAKTGSLSMFAISYQKKEEIKEEPIQEEPKQEEKAEESKIEELPIKKEPSILAYSIMIALLCIAGILALKHKRKRG